MVGWLSSPVRSGCSGSRANRDWQFCPAGMDVRSCVHSFSKSEREHSGLYRRCSGKRCYSLVGIGHRTWARKIEGFDLHDLKASPSDEIIDFSIEVATSRYVSPGWSKPILPECNARVCGTTVLDKDEPSRCLQNAFHLLKSG